MTGLSTQRLNLVIFKMQLVIDSGSDHEEPKRAVSQRISVDLGLSGSDEEIEVLDKNQRRIKRPGESSASVSESSDMEGGSKKKPIPSAGMF